MIFRCSMCIVMCPVCWMCLHAAQDNTVLLSKQSQLRFFFENISRHLSRCQHSMGTSLHEHCYDRLCWLRTFDFCRTQCFSISRCSLVLCNIAEHVILCYHMSQCICLSKMCQCNKLPMFFSAFWVPADAVLRARNPW